MPQVSFTLFINSELQDLHIAMLYELGVEAFIQQDESIEAFVDLQRLEIQNAIENYCNKHDIAFTRQLHQVRDWNALWESQFHSICIKDQLLVRAPFHPTDPGVKHELIIAPKMAFGTGHHETTSMILEWMTTKDFKGMQILDFGCGTGILGIYALLKDAQNVVFIDNDPLAIENVQENLLINKLKPQLTILGDANSIPDESFHIILANITRNVLIESLANLAKSMKSGGMIALSGFLESDREDMEKNLQQNGLKLHSIHQKSDWLCIIGET
ncbi:MAG: 50S ribosomal protein L11 methyltransferase [Saprospiraceae bacterium]|nr:50S ribosomal protein L11 methyltransferase [Saprospiraceae bacterium]